MLHFCILFSVFLLLLVVYSYRSALKRPKNFPPGPPKLPIWGSYWLLLRENYNFAHLSLIALGKRYKSDIIGLYLGDFPTVAVFGNELCKEMLTREEFTGRPDTIVARARSLETLKGIFFADGPFWKAQRRFSLRHMRDFGFGRRSEDVENFVTDEVKYLVEFFKSDPSPKDMDICRGKGHVLMPDLLYGPLLNSILTVLASTRCDNYELREFARAGLRVQRSSDPTGAALSCTPWLRFVAPNFFGYTSTVEDSAYMLNYLKLIIDDHLKSFSDDHHRNFIDVFISESKKEGQTLDYYQLWLLVLDYVFPVPIAVGHTLSFYFVFIINHPEVQIKIQKEIDRVVGRSRLPHLDDRKLMPYLEASIREAIRIFPINPLGIPRRCVQDTHLGGYSIPKDTIMLPCVWSAHRDERIWKNPERFEPERFLDDDGNLLKKDYTMGFGAGKRLCAGETFARQNMFLIVAGLLQNFTMESPNGKPVELDIVSGVNLSMRENWIVAKPR